MDPISIGRSIVIIMSLVSFFGLAFYTLRRWTHELRATSPTPVSLFKHRKPWWQIFLFALSVIIASRLILLSAGYFSLRITGYESGFLQSIRDQFFRWDVGQYVLISDEWYANFGDQRLAIVFFPLYPALMRALNIIVHNSFVSGLIISNLSLAGAMTVLYNLVSSEIDEDSGIFAVGCALFAPMAFFFSNVFSESLFLLLTLGAVYSARRRWFLAACLLGGLATATRLLGFIVAVPIFIEMVNAFREDYIKVKQEGKKWSIVQDSCALFILFIPLALLSYLWLNYKITGDPLEFLSIQESHWYNTRGNMFNTAGYLFVNAATTEYPINFDLWATQFLALFSVIGLTIASRRKLRVSELAYTLVYLFFAFMSNWMLSGARYLLALYAVYPAMAHIFKRQYYRYAIISVSAITMLLYYMLFIGGRNIL